MIKTYLYIPEELNDKITFVAKMAKKSKAEVMREALTKSLPSYDKKVAASANVLLRLAEIGKNHTFKGPKDSSQRIDELLWGKEWKDE